MEMFSSSIYQIHKFYCGRTSPLSALLQLRKKSFPKYMKGPLLYLCYEPQPFYPSKEPIDTIVLFPPYISIIPILVQWTEMFPTIPVNKSQAISYYGCFSTLFPGCTMSGIRAREKQEAICALDTEPRQFKCTSKE